MTLDQLLQVINSLGVTPDQLGAFLANGMKAMQLTGLANQIEKLRAEQATYNADKEGQVQAIQQQINALQAEIVKAA